MDNQQRLKYSTCAAVLSLGFHTSAIAAPKMIYGPELCVKTRPNHTNAQYIIELGIFKHQSLAISYQKKIKHLTQYPVQIRYVDRLDSHMVVLGPVNNDADLQHACKKILDQKHPAKHNHVLHTQKKINLVYTNSNNPVNQPSKTEHIVHEAQHAQQAYQYAPHPYVGGNTGLLLNTSGVPATYAGLEGTIFTGFKVQLKHEFYIAAEFLGSNSHIIKNAYRTILPITAQSSWIYGLHVLPGYAINDFTSFYVPIGAVRTAFVKSANGIPGQSRTGFQVGLGTQNKITKNIDVRLEYLFTDYHKRTDLPRLASLQRAHMYGDQFSFGVVYLIDN